MIVIREGPTIEDRLFRAILAGQCLKRNTGVYYVMGTRISGLISKYIPISNVLENDDDNKEILSHCEKFVDGYTCFPIDNPEKEYNVKISNYDKFMSLINNITRSDKFIMVSFNDEQESVCRNFNIPFIHEDKIYPVNDFVPELVYVRERVCDHLVDMAIAYSMKMVYRKFYFPAPKTNKLTMVYGSTSLIEIGSNVIPLEQMILADMARKGYQMIWTESTYNAAMCYHLDSRINNYKIPPVVPLSDKVTTNHKVCIIMSDGDNVGFMYYKLPYEMSKKRIPEYPLTWALNSHGPHIFYEAMYPYNKEHTNDFFILGENFPVDQVSETIRKQFFENTIAGQKKFGFSIVNIIENKLINSVYDYSKVKYPFDILLFNYFNYSLNRKNTKSKITTNKVLMFSWDNISNCKFEGPYTILVINMNLIKIEGLNKIVQEIQTKRPDVSFVNLQELQQLYL